MNETTDQSCQRLLTAFFKKFPNPPLQAEADRMLKSLLDFKVPMPGKSGGWAGGIVYALANQYRRACGVPGLLNKECEAFFNVSMAMIYKRAAKIRQLVPIEFNSQKKDSEGKCEMGQKVFSEQAITGMQEFSKYIAIVIRNAMEDFHCQHLSDAQMKELNPIIRNAVYTAMYTYESSEKSEMSKSFVEYHLLSIPKYWEEPELLKGFKKSEEKRSGPSCVPDV